MKTAAVAAAVGYSAQQVRDLEALGVIPPAARSHSGYRQFSTDHVQELRAYRDLAHAVGPVAARRAMRQIRIDPPDQAVALICEFYAKLNQEREQTLAARSALESIRAEATTDDTPAAADSMTITQLAQALGVRASALRFWESVGLIAPERVTTTAGAARRYPITAIREARITAALRASGYRVPEAQKAINALHELADTTDSLAALDARLQSIAQRALALLRAGALLARTIQTNGPEQHNPVSTTS